MGVVTLIYDHHAGRIAERLTELQHQHLDRVVTTTHVHLDARRCLEVILLRGPARAGPRAGRRPDRHQGRRDGPARPGRRHARGGPGRASRPCMVTIMIMDLMITSVTITAVPGTQAGCLTSRPLAKRIAPRPTSPAPWHP